MSFLKGHSGAMASPALRLIFTNSACADALAPYFTYYPYPHLPAESLALLDSFMELPQAAMPKEIGDAVRRLVAYFPQYSDDVKAAAIEKVMRAPALSACVRASSGDFRESSSIGK